MKRTICSLLVAFLLLSLFPALLLTVNAEAPEKTELAVKWNVGYVGGITHSSQKNKLVSGSAGWNYTDIITVPEAGTKISFDVEYTSTVKYYALYSIYVFSNWTNNTTMDLTQTNIIGNGSYKGYGQVPTANGMHYEYITDKANQKIRICLKYIDEAHVPKIYIEKTTEPSTAAQIAVDNFTATIDASATSGTLTGLKWFGGYTSSASNTNGSKMEIRTIDSNGTAADYAHSGLFLVPKKGTEITFTWAGGNNSAFNAFTRYKLSGNNYIYDNGAPANSNLVVSGSKYTYTTSVDNEILRIGIKLPAKSTAYFLTQPSNLTVTWKVTGNAGTLSSLENQKTEWPDPKLLSLVTGAPLIGKELTDITWNHGYIGSQYHDSAKLTITSPTNVEYYYSSIIEIPKKGTTLYFFDQTFTDFKGGISASTSAMTVSQWTQIGPTTWVLDDEAPYYTGCDAYSILLTKEYRHYAYTSTSDNEMIRLCLRYAPMYDGEDAVIPPVYMLESTDFDAEQPTEFVAGLSDGSYSDRSGSTVSYKYYLPYGSETPTKQYSLVFDNSADGAVAKYLAENRVANSIVVAYSGDLDTSLRLLDEVVANYPVTVADLLFVGGDELGAHLKAFENIRLAQSFLYTGSGTAPTFTYAKVNTLSSLGDAEAAAKWLIGEYDDYYNVLDGLKMYAIGDSYFGGSSLGQHQTWVNLLGYKYGMEFHNYGIGGNHIAIVNGVEGNQPSMCTRYEEMPLGGDIYFVEGGRNDRHHSTPFGTNDSTDNKTYKGAINTIVKYLREKNPNAMIVLVTPFSYATETGYLGSNNDYADAMKELVDYYNDKHIVCLYAADTEFSGVDMSIPAFRSEYCLTASDVSHLNANGMYMIFPAFEKWIAEKYAELNSLTVENAADDKTLFLEAVDNPEDTTTATPSDTTTEAPAQTTTEPEERGCGGIAVFAQLAALICGTIGFAIIKKIK